MGRLFSRGAKQEQVPRTSQVEFIESMNGLLDEASAPETELRESLSSAQQVTKKLAEVAEGRLLVQPPLTHEQFSAFKEKATMIENIGQKAVASLGETSQAREATGSNFQGHGSSPKS